MQVTFTSFITSPDETLAEIFRFTGVDPIPFPETPRPGVDEKYLDEWRNLWSPYREWMTERFGPRMQRFSYDLRSI